LSQFAQGVARNKWLSSGDGIVVTVDAL